MREILKTNNPVELNFAEVILADAGIDCVVFDGHMSVMDGSMVILPRRLMVADERCPARRGHPARGAEREARMGMSIAYSEDRFLGGRVILRQPVAGFRAGLDAVMLAACIPAKDGEEILELGSGAGTASLCLAARVSGCNITGIEIDPSLVELANENAAANKMENRVRFVAGRCAGA